MVLGAEHNQEGLVAYESWDIERAVEAFSKAVQADPENPDYHINLARAYARGSRFHDAIQSLGEYLRTETDEQLASRYEQLFSSAFDEVEKALIEGMKALDLSIPLTGKAIQMWLEYRIAVGRRPVDTPDPALWAAALAYTAIKVNFVKLERATVAETFHVDNEGLKDRFIEVVKVLDIMPADFRYFTGEQNPLDKLVEAAQILEDLDQRFRDE